MVITMPEAAMKPSIETISIMGAGAMGCAYAGIFYDMDPGCVSFVAGGAPLEHLRQHTPVVNGRAYPIPVLGPGDDAPFADLVIVAVKHHHLDAAIRDMVRRVGDHTTILSVMNGI
jgi:2-dehydropantoate 2-reductase